MRHLVLKIRYGGLGDHLFFSPIPRIAKQTGTYDKVSISNLSTYRNPMYKHLIWELNPYIDGFSDEDETFNCQDVLIDFDTENLLDALMKANHVDDGLRFHEPEVYFQPPHNEEWQLLTIYDPNYISNAGNNIKTQFVKRYFHDNGIVINMQLKPTWGRKNRRIFGIPNIATPDFMDFCSLIVSCKSLFCFATGTATLACALKKPVTVFYDPSFNRAFLHSKKNNYVCLGQHP